MRGPPRLRFGPELRLRLLHDTTGNAVTGVARRVGLIIIGASMHNKGCAALLEQGGVWAPFQRDRSVQNLDGESAAVRHVQVRHVTRMRSFRSAQAVFPALRIEMAFSRGEGRLAPAYSVHMKGVRARRDAAQIDSKQHPVRRLREFDRADAFALVVLEL